MEPHMGWEGDLAPPVCRVEHTGRAEGTPQTHKSTSRGRSCHKHTWLSIKILAWPAQKGVSGTHACHRTLEDPPCPDPELWRENAKGRADTAGSLRPQQGPGGDSGTDMAREEGRPLGTRCCLGRDRSQREVAEAHPSGCGRVFGEYSGDEVIRAHAAKVPSEDENEEGRNEVRNTWSSGSGAEPWRGDHEAVPCRANSRGARCLQLLQARSPQDSVQETVTVKAIKFKSSLRFCAKH